MASLESPSVDLHWRCADLYTSTQVHAVSQLDVTCAFVSIGTQREGLIVRRFPLLDIHSINASFGKFK